MKKYIGIIKILSLAMLAPLVLAGCYFFGVQGSFRANNYQIEKIVIDNETYLSPQELAKEAKLRLADKQNIALQDSKQETTQTQSTNQNLATPKANDNSAQSEFEKLQLRAQEESAAASGQTATNTKPTSDKVLSQIILKATFSLNRAENILHGSTGCNEYTGRYAWQDSGRIVISGIASTRKICFPSEVQSFESNLIQYMDGIYTVKVLGKGKGYILDNGRLQIYLK
ncbi:hypothetical protein BKH43_08130 [Helicobacter sp. 13S00401-1]|uniref:META domain-containing protein n=1 Tax=Helicobacter sp. 13S00401-1 TaxID=1905758 RepID=UPI000BA5C719|nr:META domain-containing protein [Helicobacter sp. 13S00401-1]PAF47719.1 hypothetical protein BKH43_08130 [Helicobacter sp. 13S00401-1]